MQLLASHNGGRFGLRPVLLTALLASVGPHGALGQETSDLPPNGEADSAAISAAPLEAAPAGDPARAAFDAALADYKASIREIEQLQTQYQSADVATREKLNQQLAAHVAHTQLLVNTLVEAGISAYRAAPGGDPQIAELLKAVARHRVVGRELRSRASHYSGGDQYEEAMPILEVFREAGTEDARLLLWGFLTSFALNEHEVATEYLSRMQQPGALAKLSGSEDKVDQELFQLALRYAQGLPEYRQMWAKESALRAAEAEADDLPRVKLTTSKGEITLELFENEAPIAVANFISLVKSGFYEGRAFHRVIPRFMAQGGAAQDDGTGGPGYVIRCESHQPNARMHFRGSLSMAHRGRDTGNSQFFLTFLPTSHLDGGHTVFGRVVDGMEVLGDITRRVPTGEPAKDALLPEPDRILKAEVLRDRGHAYEFERLPGS